MKKRKALLNPQKRIMFCAFCTMYGAGIAASPTSSDILSESEAIQTVAQNGRTIKGVVTDNYGPVIGANVLVKGTKNGMVTDMDGNFTLTNVPDGAILQISYIGYATQEITVDSRNLYQIKLQEDNETLDEVVVVGYGSQKKVNLTGSIGQIDSKVLESRPITSTTSALQGTIPNLQITNNSGEPGQAASINVRGTTSINGGSPLVLVDGVEMSLDLVNPNDIANVTVLKDAAASAIYGVRAAFGVILVTTKSPQKVEKTSVSYSGNFSFAQPSVMPEFIESQSQFAEWMNQACANGNVQQYIRSEVIDKMKAYEADPVNNPAYEVIDGNLYYYGYSNFRDQMIKKTSFTQRHNINITGGSEKTRFYTSVGYLDQNGIYKVGDDSFKQVNTRINIENQATKWMKLGFKALYNYSTQNKPHNYHNDVWEMVVFSQPSSFSGAWCKDPRYPQYDRFEGMYTENDPYYILKEAGRNKYDQHDVWLTASVDFDILKGWKAHIDFNYNLKYKKASDHSKPLTFFTNKFEETNGDATENWYQMTNDNTNYYSFNAYTDYEHTFGGKHYLKAMIGFNQELTKYSTFSGKRYNLLSNETPTLSLGYGNYEASQNGYEWALRGGFFRLNYIYNDRYLFEFNGRYDGTSRFPSNNRFVFLPSFSAAWRISEEKFMKNTRSWLDNLKIRASYGMLGNQMISSSDWTGNTQYYPYIPFMSNGTSTNWMLGNSYVTTVNPENLVSTNLTWEKVSTVNAGIDLTLFQQRFDMSFDYYVRKTSDMLIKTALPDVLGTTAPPANSAELKTRGWELSMKWRDKIGQDFGYEVGLVLSDSQAEITKYNNPTGDISTYYKGSKIGEIWGYETEGLFQSDEEAANWHDQSQISNVDWGAGDIKFKDQNGDDAITPGSGTLSNHGDQVIIGNTTPRYQYGITANLTYKDFYMNIFFQGIGKRDAWFSGNAFWPAATQYYNVQKWHVEESWSPNNPDAYLPIPRATDNRNRVAKTDRYLQDASYCRLKNLTIGWNLPKRWISKVFLTNATVYVSGENLFYISKIKGPYDPEALSGNGNMIYPFMRTYSIGVNLTF